MIKEAYVSFETAKLLKEKGFDEQLCHFYTEEGLPVVYKTEEGVVWANNSKSEHAVVQPTQQMAMRWLREVHKLFCSISYDDLNYNWTIIDISADTDKQPYYVSKSYAGYVEYEDACEAAIKYCLEHLKQLI